MQGREEVLKAAAAIVTTGQVLAVVLVDGWKIAPMSGGEGGGEGGGGVGVDEVQWK